MDEESKNLALIMQIKDKIIEILGDKVNDNLINDVLCEVYPKVKRLEINEKFKEKMDKVIHFLVLTEVYGH